MIDFSRANKYCCEDISLIENYELAINDKTHTWVCHHRLETDLDLSWKELIALGMYYNRPASELIFLTKAEHRKVHQTGRHHSVETIEKIRKGNTGKHHTQETKDKMSKAKKGLTPWNKGKQTPEETKKKIIENCPTRKHVYQIDKNTGEIIKKWIGIREAARALNINASNMIQCCKGKAKSAGGYVWKYADDLEKVV